MSNIQNKIVDAVFEGNDEVTRDLVKELSYVKTRKILGLIESDEVTIRGNDIFVGGNTVGSFQTKDDKIEFTSSNDGAVHTFENDEELMNYVSSITEDMKEVKAPEGYDKHELASHHKDERMEKPKKKDHGHDVEQKEPTGSDSGSNPPDKETELKNHEGGEPNGKEHGHDDPSGTEDPKASSKGSNPPDKETELKKHEGGEPSGKEHGHDDASGVGKVEKKGK